MYPAGGGCAGGGGKSPPSAYPAGCGGGGCGGGGPNCSGASRGGALATCASGRGVSAGASQVLTAFWNITGVFLSGPTSEVLNCL